MNVLTTPNIPRIFTALAEWLACIIYLSQLPRRLTGRKFVVAAGLALILQCLWLCLTGRWLLILWLPCMAFAIGLMFVFIVICADIPLAGAGYCTARAFLLAELMASLEWQLFYYATNSLGWSGLQISLVFLLVIYGAGYSLTWLLEKRWRSNRSIYDFSFRELWPAIVIALVTFSMSNLSFLYSGTPFTSQNITDIHSLRTSVAFSGVVTLYAYHVQRKELYTKRELASLQNVLQNQYAQYQQSKESIEVINRKYHDLKHQIAILRAEPDNEKRLAFLDQMEDEIKNYEAQNKTGNSVLDTVLTSKSLYCAQHHIELTCMADGSKLDFMDTMDICTIFGNALDNAIEYVQTISDPGKRLIYVNLFVRKRFMVIRVKNYFEGELSTIDGLPATTKADVDYHGFGLKSIRHTCEKYGGSMELSAIENWFSLQLLIPRNDIEN